MAEKQQSHPDSLNILRLRDVKACTGLSRSTIYLRIKQGSFPNPVSLGDRAVGWLEHEVQAWVRGCVAASRAPAQGEGE